MGRRPLRLPQREPASSPAARARPSPAARARTLSRRQLCDGEARRGSREVVIMAYSDAEYSDNESVNGIEDSEYECEAGHVDGAANVVGNSEDDIDDATLVKSFKILRRMTKQIASGIGRQGVSTRSTVDVSNVEAGPSKPITVKANSRSNQSYFKDVIMALNDHQKQVVTDYGFGDLLQFDGCPVPRRFVQWIADHIDEKCHDIHVNGEIKKFEETCYANVSVFGDQYHVLKRALGERFAYLPENVRNGICGLYEFFSIQGFAAPDYSPDQLVIQIFQYLQDEISVADNAETGNLNDGAAGNSNQEDPHHSMNNNDGNEDANTEKLDSDGDYQESGACSIGKINKKACDEVARKHEEYNRTKLRQSALVNAVSSKVPVEDVNEITRCEFNKKNVNDKVASEGHRVCSASKPPPAAGSFKNSNVENAEASKNSCPDPKVVCHGNTVAADFHEKYKFTKKAPYFNSPSVPSFRFFDDEDDMENYVEDVNLRRPVGCSGIPTPTNSASTSSHHSSGILPKGSRLHERVLSAYKLPKANVEHNINPEASQSTASNNNSHDKFAFEDYLIMESLSNTDDETNEVRDVSGPYSAQPIGFLNNDGEYVILSQGLKDNNDVTITGERAANDKLSAMCHDSDQYYDNSIGTSDRLAVSGSSSGKLANHRARRVHVRSRYQVSPYMNERPKICLTNREKEVYDVVLQLSRSDHDNELAILYKHVKVTFNSLGSSLGPNGKMQTFVVNAYCKYLFGTKHPRQSYKHFFFTKVSDYLLECYTSPAKKKELRDYAVKSFNGANSARKLYNSNLLYFLIFYRNHWLLIVVDLKNRFYLYLEPDCANYGPDSAYHRQMKETFAKNFFAIWEQTVQLDCGIPLLKGPYFADVLQNDGGVFILKLLEVFEPNVNLYQKFTQVDIPNIRKKFVNEMIFAPKNEMVDSVELVKTYKPEVCAKYFAK
ncbi:hypothetical protein EJB05_01225, partial [Eragrostis curvula]